jgi:hypothetical protein
MRAKLIIAVWLVSLCLLTYTGEDLVMTFVLVSIFCYTSYLINKYSDEVSKEADKVNKWVDKQINK